MHERIFEYRSKNVCILTSVMRANVSLRKHILLRFTAFKLYLTQRGTKLLTFYFVENLLLLKNDNICVKHRVLNDLAFSFCRFPSLYLQLNFLFLWVPLCMLSLSMFISFFLLQIFLNCNILDNLFTFSFFLSFFLFLFANIYLWFYDGWDCAQPWLRNQPCYKAPGDLWVETE